MSRKSSFNRGSALRDGLRREAADRRFAAGHDARRWVRPGSDDMASFMLARGSRRRLTGLESGLDAESLGVSPDGAFLTVSFREQLFDLMVAEGVPGIE